MEKFTDHSASLCSSSSSSSKQSRLNLAIVSTFLASISFLTLRFSPNSFLTLLLLLLIPSTLFLAKKKSDSNQVSDHNPLLSSGDGHLFDEKPQRRAEEESGAKIGGLRRSEELSSDGESSSDNGGLGSGDFESDDLWMCLDELARNLPFSSESEDSSSEDDDSLIEIALLPNPNAVTSDLNGEEVRNLETCLADLLPDSVLRQQGFEELLEEINEEDNLIEIDISRGFNRFSTVCN